MRKNIFRFADMSGMKIDEQTIALKELMNSDELFLTNAIRGLQWVERIGDKIFQNTASKILFDFLVKESKPVKN